MGKNQQASGLTNVIQYNNGNITFVSGSTTLMSISSSGAITTTGVISGSNVLTASYANNAELLDGLDSTAFATTGAYSATSGSLYTVSSSAYATSGSLSATSGSLSAASGSFNTRVSALEATGSALSSSILSVSSSAYATSGSLSAASGSFNTRVATIESKYATTGSNNFRAPQYISDTTVPTGFSNTTGSIYTDGGLQVTKDAYFSSSMYIKGNLTIYGTQSVAYITSSQLNIATNLITVNTATPAVRFGGLAVYDSGSTGTGMTGSLLWDSQNNSWIYNNPSGSGNYDSSMVIMGPRNASALGSEQGLTCNYLVQGHGHHHTTSSGIFHDGSTTCFPGNVCASSVVLATGGTINNLANIQYSGYTWASYNTGTGAITLQNAAAGGININAGVACFANTVCAAGHVSSEDVRIYRSAGTTTGYINFGSTGTNYFGFDGSKYVANGCISATGGLFSGNVGIGPGSVTDCYYNSQLVVGSDATTNNGFTMSTTATGASAIWFARCSTGVGRYRGSFAYNQQYDTFYWRLGGDVLKMQLDANAACFAGAICTPLLYASSCAGIGTAASSYTLSVGGRGYFFATNQDAGWGNLTLDYGNGDNSNIYAIQMKEGGAVNAAIGYGSYGASSCGDIVMWTNDSGGLVERMRMYPNGTTRFYVQESTSQTNGVGVVGRTCSKAVYIGTNCTYGYIQSHGSVPLYINELGNNVVMGLAANVGIGTANASSKLTVLKTITTCPGATGNAALSLGTAGSAGEYNLINFGYDSESWQPAYMGYLTTSGAGSSNGALVFATRSDTTNSQPTEKLRITSAGIASFACQICAPASSITSYIGNTICLSSGFVGGSNKFIFANSANTINAITYDTFVIQADDVTTLKLIERNVGSVDQVFTMAVGDSNARLSTTCALPMQFYVGGSPSGCGYYGLGGTLALSIACSGISIFNCNVCIPKSVTFGTALFRTNVPSQGDMFSIQQSLGGCGFTAQAGGDYIHIKTNVTKDDRMVGFNVRGYMYSPNIVDTDIGFYTYSPVGYVYGVTVYNKAYTGWNYCLYYSSDNKVVLVVQGSSTYGGFVLTGINTARYNQMGEICILGVAQATCWCAQF